MDDTLKLTFLDTEHVFTKLDGKAWTLAEPLVIFLGFGTNVSRALKRHCHPYHYRVIKTFGNEGRSPLYVSLAGLIRLTIKSDVDSAQDFQDWITDDVVPQVLIEGYYINEDKFTMEQVEKLKKAFVELTKLSEELVTDLKLEYRKKIETLLYGSMDVHGRQRRSRTFTHIIKELYNMGFNYDASRMKHALKLYNQVSKTIELPINLSCSCVGYNKIKLMECIYESMRYDGDVTDPDESQNMQLFYKEFGIRSGIPIQDYDMDENISHERIKKVAKLKSKVS